MSPRELSFWAGLLSGLSIAGAVAIAQDARRGPDITTVQPFNRGPELVDLRPGGVDQDGNAQALRVDRVGYLMVAVERREELEQVARYLDGKNVVLLYRDKDGLFQHWKPRKCAP